MEDTKLNECDTGVDPFLVSITIAAYCNLIFRRNYMVKDSIGIIPCNGYNPNQKTSKKAKLWLKYISEKENIFIQHANNTGEFECGPYFLDGLCETNKTIYEFHGCFWHGCTRCYKSTTFNNVQQMCQFSVNARHSERIKYIKNTMPDYKLIEMWECDWTKLTTNDTSIINFLKDTEIVENLNVRESLYGGRTQAFKLYHKCTELELFFLLFNYIILYGCINTS